jgi:oxygen-dependent protoporphyrinogen oxidase
MECAYNMAAYRSDCGLSCVNDSRIRRVAVVGGGIAGLAAAHRLIELSRERAQPIRVTLFDESTRLGGVFGTESVDGYRLELGADMFITDKPWGLDLSRRLGLAERLVSPDPRYRKSLILHRGRPVPTPTGFNLMAPAKFWPMLTTPLLSWRGKLRLVRERFLPVGAESQAPDESLAGFVRRRLGSEALERIVQPLVGGIYTGDPEKLSIEATLPRFRALERDYGSLTRGLQKSKSSSTANPSTRGNAHEVSGARYGLFISFPEGMRELQEALIGRIRAGGDVRQPVRVHCVGPCAPASESSPTTFQVRWSRRDATSDVPWTEEEFDAVVLAVPSYRAADMLRASQPGLAGRLDEIEYASSVLVVTGHRLEDIAHPLDAYGLVVPAIERRRILAVSFLSRKFPTCAPPGRVVLRTFIGGALQPELCEGTDDELRDLALGELSEMLGVRGQPEVVRIVRYRQAMPQYHVGHLDRIREIERLTSLTPGLALCGNAYRGVGIPDCIHDGELAAERVVQ